MIYLAHVPKGELADDYEFDGEHANCCTICKYNGCISVDTNELGIYYDPPINCEDKDACEHWCKTFIEPYRKIESKWDLVKKA